MNIIETENLSYKYDESHFALSDLSIGFEKRENYNNSRCKRSRQINIVSEYERNFKAAFGDSKIYG